jgi:hypothetical protein
LLKGDRFASYRPDLICLLRKGAHEVPFRPNAKIP